MDKLKMGDVTLQGSVHFTTARVAEQSVPALELRVEGPVNEAVLEAVKEGLTREMLEREALRQAVVDLILGK